MDSQVIRDKKDAEVIKLKKSITLEQLCEGLPLEFLKYMKHVRSLAFEEEPNYSMLHNLIEQLMKKSGYKFDHEYDWVIKREALVRELSPSVNEGEENKEEFNRRAKLVSSK